MFGHSFKNIAACRIFNSLHCVWRCGQSRSFEFDIVDNKNFVKDFVFKFLFKREYNLGP